MALKTKSRSAELNLQVPQRKNPSLSDQFYELILQHVDPDSPLNMERQSEENTNPFSIYADDPVGFVENVLHEHVTPDVEKMLLSVQSNTITVARSANATGKTHGAARAIVWVWKCKGNGRETVKVITAAAPPEDNLKLLLWGELSGIMERNPHLFENDIISILNVYRRSQSNRKKANTEFYITGIAIPSTGSEALRKAKFSGKHAEYLFFVCDEGDAIPDEIYEAIDTCMSGGWARLLIMFNPRHASGPVYIMERDRKANIVELSAFRHPNVVLGPTMREIPSLEGSGPVVQVPVDPIPGAVTRAKTVKRIVEWTRPLGLEEEAKYKEETQNVLINGKWESETVEVLAPGYFEVPSFLVGEVALSDAGLPYPPLTAGIRVVVDPQFSYIVLGKYPAQAANQLISQTDIDNAVSRWYAYNAMNNYQPPPYIQPILGQDVGEEGPDLSVTILRYGGYVANPHFWQGIDPTTTGDRAAQIAKATNARQCNVDASGVGAGTVGRMRQLHCVNVKRVMVQSKAPPEAQTLAGELGEFGNVRDWLYWCVREWLRTDPGAMLPPVKELLEELAAPTYNTDSGVVKVMPKKEMRKLLKRSPNYLDALTLTFYDDKPAPAGMRVKNRRSGHVNTKTGRLRRMVEGD